MDLVDFNSLKYTLKFKPSISITSDIKFEEISIIFYIKTDEMRRNFGFSRIPRGQMRRIHMVFCLFGLMEHNPTKSVPNQTVA